MVMIAKNIMCPKHQPWSKHSARPDSHKGIPSDNNEYALLHTPDDTRPTCDPNPHIGQEPCHFNLIRSCLIQSSANIRNLVTEE